MIQSPRRAALMSDEENTSEYSHPPSSQHSTLESNPDISQMKRMQKRGRSKSVDGTKIISNIDDYQITSGDSSADSDEEDAENVIRKDSLNGNNQNKTLNKFKIIAPDIVEQVA